MSEGSNKAAWIAAVASVLVALIGGGVTIYTTLHKKGEEGGETSPGGAGPPIEEPGSEGSGGEGPGEFEPLPLARTFNETVRAKMNVPLKSIAASEFGDDDIRVSLHAPAGTSLWLDVYQGRSHVGQVVGSVTFADEESWEEGKRMIDRVVKLDRRNRGAIEISGLVITAGGAEMKVAPTMPDFDDVYDAHLEVSESGKVMLIQAKACPWVYVEAPASRGVVWEKRVEIIQNLHDKRFERTQKVRLGTVTAVSDHEIALQIREELDEVSYIDAIWIELDGDSRRILPSSSLGEVGSLRKIDGDYLVLHKGDVVEIAFRDARFVAGGDYSFVISATGYYETE